MGNIVVNSPIRIGKCAVKTQGKLLVHLNGINLPKIGARALIKKDGKEKYIGEVSEAIGSTQSPWIVISAKKTPFEKVAVNDVIYTQDVLKLKKSKKYRERKKTAKKRKI
jgi:rRNA processing protein Gar1